MLIPLRRKMNRPSAAVAPKSAPRWPKIPGESVASGIGMCVSITSNGPSHCAGHASAGSSCSASSWRSSPPSPISSSTCTPAVVSSTIDCDATKSCRCKQGFGCNDASCGTCTTKPTAAPTVAPSAQPTTMPTTAPTAAPSATPTIWGDFGVLCSFLFSRIKSENLTHLSLSLPRPCNRRRRFRAGGAG